MTRPRPRDAPAVRLTFSDTPSGPRHYHANLAARDFVCGHRSLDQLDAETWLVGHLGVPVAYDDGIDDQVIVADEVADDVGWSLELYSRRRWWQRQAA